jgi:hypothetical protein
MNSDSPESRLPVDLYINHQMMTAEIRVFDANFQCVAEGVGELHAKLPPGVYEVESVIGQDRERRFVVLNPGKSENLTFNLRQKMDFSSAAPLAYTSTTREWQEGPAIEWSRKTTMPGPGATYARLFVFVRTLEPQKYQATYDRDLSLLDENGKVICDFDQGVVRDREHGWTALSVDLKPGGYVLSRGGRGRPARFQAVWLSEGWDTQVFVPARQRPQLEEMSYFMSHYSSGFDPVNDTALASETILEGLKRGVNLASSDQMRFMLTEKFENPWLGILALHALHLEQDADQNLMNIVYHNVSGLIDGHPDLRALGLKPGKTVPVPFTFPPVLYASLKLVREHASQFPGTVSPSSLLSRLFDALLADSAWVSWRTLPPLERVPKPIENAKNAFFVASGSKWVVPRGATGNQVGADVALSDLFDNPDLPENNPLAADLLWLSEIYSFDNPPSEVLYSVDPSPLFVTDDSLRISKQLNLPFEKVEHALLRMRENPELLTQPRLMTITELAVADSVLARRSAQQGGAQQDRSVRRGGETGLVSLTASINVLIQTRTSLERLSKDKLDDVAMKRNMLNHFNEIHQRMIDHQDAVLLVDANTQVVYASASFEKLDGHVLAELAMERMTSTSSATLSSLSGLPGNLADIPLPTTTGLRTFRVLRLPFVDEISRQMFATVYRLRAVDQKPPDPNLQRDIRRTLNSITYYASVLNYCSKDERDKYTSYIGRDLFKLDSLTLSL